MSWNGFSGSEGFPPEQGTRLSQQGRQAMWDEPAPRILCACSFAPGKVVWQGGVVPGDVLWLSLKAVPWDPVMWRYFLSAVSWELVKAKLCPTVTATRSVQSCPAGAELYPSFARDSQPRLLWKLGCPSHSLWISITCTASIRNRSRKKVISESVQPVPALLSLTFAHSLVTCLLGWCLFTPAWPPCPPCALLQATDARVWLWQPCLCPAVIHTSFHTDWQDQGLERRKVTCTSEPLP